MSIQIPTTISYDLFITATNYLLSCTTFGCIRDFVTRQTIVLKLIEFTAFFSFSTYYVLYHRRLGLITTFIEQITELCCFEIELNGVGHKCSRPSSLALLSRLAEVMPTFDYMSNLDASLLQSTVFYYFVMLFLNSTAKFVKHFLVVFTAKDHNLY